MDGNLFKSAQFSKNYTTTELSWGAQQGFPCGSGSKASAYNARDPGSIPGLGRSSGEGNDNPLQYSCLENPMDVVDPDRLHTVHGVAKSWTRLSDFINTPKYYFGSFQKLMS